MTTCNHYGCDKPAAPDKKQCRPHLDAARDYQVIRRELLKKEGKCVRCAEPSRPGKTMCQECADKWNNYLRGRREEKKEA